VIDKNDIAVTQPALNLIVKLCHLLDKENITYCHWKSNNALDRSASGENDLDLLIERTDISRFTAILNQLGFKQAFAITEKQMIAVHDYYGYDEETDKMVHVHAHFQLTLGHDKTKNFRLPIEKQYLNSSFHDQLFKIPTPEFEFVVFIIRMNLKYSTWDVVLRHERKMKTSERQEFEYLKDKINKDIVNDIIDQCLPFIGIELFDSCINALEPGISSWKIIKTGQMLQSRLLANTRRPLPFDAYMKLWRKYTIALRRRISKSSLKHRFAGGGAMFAIVGGDGAGKTTVVNELYDWLSDNFYTIKVHMGKPRESKITILVRALLRIGCMLGLYPHLNSNDLYKQPSKSSLFPGKYPWMIREACKARDRYLTYVRAKRHANKGGIVICDRYPLPQIKLMDGPTCLQITKGTKLNRASKRLIEFEEKYYQSIRLPELVALLKVNPEIAVKRKTDENPVDVRIRSTEIWEIDWQNSEVRVIDGSQSQIEVLSSVKSLIWTNL